MTEQNEKQNDVIDLGNDPISDDFDPFASDDDFMDEIKTDTTTQQESQKKETSLTSTNPLTKTIGKAEDKSTESVQKISEYLSSEITELFDNKEITKATALLVCKLTSEEQKAIFSSLELHNADDTVNEQLNRAVVELTAKDKKNQKLIERQAKEIHELKTRESESVEVEVPPNDYDEVKQSNQSLKKEIAKLRARLEETDKVNTTHQSDTTSGNKETVSFLVPCTIEDLPEMDEIDSVTDRDSLLEGNPNLLLSQISCADKNKSIAYKILERALCLTNEINSLLVSWDDYVTLICEYDGSNFQKLVAKIQKYKTHKI